MVPDQHGNLTKPDDDAEVSFLLASGKEWHPFRPHFCDFDWDDIATGASRIPRFNGQTSTVYAAKAWDNYVLAQHLCLAHDLLVAANPDAPIEVRLAVLLHDAEEPLGGLGDPVGPVKHSPMFRTLFKAYFDPILDVIAVKAGIEPSLLHSHPDVKPWDKAAYAVENWLLRGIRDDDVPTLPQRHQDGGRPNRLRIWNTNEARAQWLGTLKHLFSRRKGGQYGRSQTET
jgi:hypothetical protein